MCLRSYPCWYLYDCVNLASQQVLGCTNNRVSNFTVEVVDSWEKENYCISVSLNSRQARSQVVPHLHNLWHRQQNTIRQQRVTIKLQLKHYKSNLKEKRISTNVVHRAFSNSKKGCLLTHKACDVSSENIQH